MAEEEFQEVMMIKHVCKFCNKRFPCGRSLGGHMRSHVTTNTVIVAASSSHEDTEGSETNAASVIGYGLRENPKKTWRLTDSTGGEDHQPQKEKDANFAVVLDNLCKECGKGFQSLKALFGHMKCHSDHKERVSKNNSFDDDQDSWKENSQSDNNTEEAATSTVPKRKRRSKRRRTRYTNFDAAPSSSVSISVSEAELEQEEVALSLMMLSRDVSSNWAGVNSNNNNNNNNNSEFPLTDDKSEGKKRVISNCSEISKLTKSKDNKLEFGNSASSILNTKGKKSSELLCIESPGKVVKKPKLESESEFEVNGEELVQSNKFFDSEHKSSSGGMMRNSGGEFSKKCSSNKRGKFECTTCKKKFNSYQALGGHRASHKRNKGCCFVSRNESSENITELEEETSELMKNSDDINELEAVKKTTSFDDDEKNKEHAVPIFVKRSHLTGEYESSSSSIHIQSQTIQESVQETRSFLDLNLPAATEEENNGNHHHVEPYKPWWIGLLAN